MIELLLSKDVDVNLRTSFHRSARDYIQSWTALHIVCELARPHFLKDIPSALRALLDAGADVNATIVGDVTPLIMVAGHGEFEQAKVLLDHGANTEYRSTYWGTAIVAAHPYIAKSLAYEIRSRALLGENEHLRPAPQPNIHKTQAAPSRIAAPIHQSGSRRRRERPLQYRHPPQYRYPPQSQTPPLPEWEASHPQTDSNPQLWIERHSDDTQDTRYDSGNNREPRSELDSGDESD
jgi:hypothetical protein